MGFMADGGSVGTGSGGGLAPPLPFRLTGSPGGKGVLVGATVLGMVLAYAAKLPCRAGAWDDYAMQFQYFCYTDIYPLYDAEGFSAGQTAYIDHGVEYPVLTGGAMQAVAWLVSIVDETIRGRLFYDVTVVLLAICAVLGVLATGRAAGTEQRRPALMVALSPALILCAFINWDLIAFALTALWLAAWSARRNVWAGVFLGLAVAAKFYPIIFIGPLVLLCWRAGRLREFWKTLVAAAASWLAVNVPVMIAAPTGWRTFYVFSQERNADWGSIWYLFSYYEVPFLGGLELEGLNIRAAGFFLAACAAIAALALVAPRRPRLPQLCFLVLVAFLVTIKVWSPQFVVWLVPLAALARPRLWPYLFWQLAEVVYFFAIWSHLVSFDSDGYPIPGGPGIPADWYFLALVLRSVGLLLLAGYVVKDILRPEQDVVRVSGGDDPAGGVLDGAEDRFRIRLFSRRAPAADASSSPTGT